MSTNISYLKDANFTQLDSVSQILDNFDNISIEKSIIRSIKFAANALQYVHVTRKLKTFSIEDIISSQKSFPSECVLSLTCNGSFWCFHLYCYGQLMLLKFIGNVNAEKINIKNIINKGSLPTKVLKIKSQRSTLRDKIQALGVVRLLFFKLISNIILFFFFYVKSN